VFARARAFRLAVENSDKKEFAEEYRRDNSLMEIMPSVITSAENRKAWIDLRETAEKKLAAQAKALPVYGFAESIKGLGAVGLGCLVAEAGIPLGEYRTVSGLWKRMGLAVFGDKRQQKCRDEDEAELHGYSPHRRAEVWAFCSDCMFRHQWRGANEETGEPARPNGPYGEVYAKRRAHTAPRVEATAHLSIKDPKKWTNGRCHNDARRIMSKALLRDLWRVWRGLPPRYAKDYDEMPGDGQGEATPSATSA
jgi:hypothetical protein